MTQNSGLAQPPLAPLAVSGNFMTDSPIEIDPPAVSERHYHAPPISPPDLSSRRAQTSPNMRSARSQTLSDSDNSENEAPRSSAGGPPESESDPESSDGDHRKPRPKHSKSYPRSHRSRQSNRGGSEGGYGPEVPPQQYPGPEFYTPPGFPPMGYPQMPPGFPPMHGYPHMQHGYPPQGYPGMQWYPPSPGPGTYMPNSTFNNVGGSQHNRTTNINSHNTGSNNSNSFNSNSNNTNSNNYKSPYNHNSNNTYGANHGIIQNGGKYFLHHDLQWNDHDC